MVARVGQKRMCMVVFRSHVESQKLWLVITPSVYLCLCVRVTVSILEDDLIVLKEQLRHDVRILPVEPQWSLC